ncbi:hypothetical protein DKT68_16085 [Micromonospora acroterricola]|uniref:Uncharacterized protein n=1 Tax=Micromonospora acroterricola TaxID=2202421 RepID=A0A317D0W9_9ACTN|nr:hypothetical protein [Micromonospora acroterricola]PWR08359.1 hypothetical protein DKT68_16085 [Micromonospora acroterricola]
MNPVVAIIGSAEADRAYTPPVRDPEGAAEAAAALGAELAIQGCHIVVYSSGPEYLERDVVRGYVGSGRAAPGSILVRGRYGKDVGFEEVHRNPALFSVVPESTDDWEVAYYRSLLTADGLLLVGGGRSTFIAGLIGLSRRIAIAPVAAFGGGAEKVWHRLSGEREVATEEEVALLSRPWQPGAAQPVVAALLAQVRRVSEREQASRVAERTASRRTMAGLVTALVLLLLTLATVPLAYAAPTGGWQTIAVLVAAPLLASVWGAIVRNAYDGNGNWLRAAALGSAAGVIAFLLFVAAQLSTNPDLLAGDKARQLVFFVLAIGFIGGFTSEVVYGKLRDQDVTQTSVLPPAGGR